MFRGIVRSVIGGLLFLAASNVLAAVDIWGPTENATGTFTVNMSGGGYRRSLSISRDGVESYGTYNVDLTTSKEFTADKSGVYTFTFSAYTKCWQFMGSTCMEPDDRQSDTHTVNVAFKPNTPSSASFSNITSGLTDRNGQFNFNWGASATPPKITGYQVQQQYNSGSWSQVYKQANTSTRTISRPTSGKLADGTYRYRVRAYVTIGSYTQWGNFRYSSTITVNRKPDPVSTFTQPGSGTQAADFQVAWSPVNGQFDTVTKYELQCKAPGKSSWGDASCTKSDNSITNLGLNTKKDISLPEGTEGTYSFQARACNGRGCGNWSPTKSVPVNIPLSPPGQTQFQNLPEESDFGDYDIEWNMPSGIVTSFELERECKTGMTTCGYEGWHSVQLPNPLSQTHEARGDVADKYRYRVRACNDDACYPSWTTSPWIDVHNLDGIVPAVSLAPATSPGAIGYSAEVTDQGDAVVSVPVQVAPGVNGLMPEIGVHYSGARYRERNNEVLPEDILGYGWRLTGFSAIRRCVKNRPDTDSIQLDSTDSLCLDGEPLVLVSGTHWQAGARYRTLRDSFNLIELKETSGKKWFQVATPSGRVQEYGNSQDSRLKAGDSVHFGWSLNKVTDAFGNTMTYRYHRDTVEGINYPLEIVYGNSGDARIEFAYGTRSDAPPQPLEAGEIEQEQLVLLHHINVSLDGKLLRGYRLITEAATEEYRRLKQVQLCGYDKTGLVSECLNPLEFSWLEPEGSNPIDIKTGVGEVTDGLGKSTRFYHTMIRENSTEGLFSERPFGEGILPSGASPLAPVNGEYRCVVSELHRSNGYADGWHVTRYSYQGTGLMSDNHWGFLGYYAQKIYDVETGVVTYRQFRQDFPHFGKVARLQQYEGNFDDNLQVLTQQQFLHQAEVLDVGSGSTYHPYLQQQLQTILENNQVIGYRLDANQIAVGSGTFGELISGEVHTTKLATGASYSGAQSYWGEVAPAAMSGVKRSSETAITYNNRTTPWIVGFSSGKEASYFDGDIGASPDRVQTLVATPFGNSSRVASVTRFPGDPENELTITYDYDATGNLLSESTAGANIESRTSLADSYSDKRYPGTFTNALGQSIGVSYDPRFGKPSTVTDANSRSTNIEYDPFGREVQRTNTDGVVFNTSYDFCAGGVCPVYGNMLASYRVSTSSAITPTVERYYDMLGRLVQQDTESFDGSTDSRREYNYDTAGRLYLETAPYFAGEYKPLNIYEYDIRNRVVRIQKAGDGEIRTSYSPLAASNQVQVTVEEDVHDAVGAFQETQAKSSFYNLMGDLVKTVDAEGSSEEVATTFEYDGMGLVQSVLVNGDPDTESTFVYDVAGNRTGLTDPNLGAVTTVYDALGQLVGQSDNKGQMISYQYDKLGRLLEQTDADGVAGWEYDPAGAIGQLASRSYTEGGSQVFQEDFSYTGGKLSGTTTSLLAGGESRSYQHGYGYDGNGRLSYVAYPSGIEAHYQYNSQGYLYEITDGTNPLKTFNTVNAFGDVEEEVYGNSVVSNRSYNADTGHLESIATAGASQIQDNQYLWRSNGTLESRLVNDGAVSKRESFSYDALNRLVSAQTALDGAVQRTLTTQYDKLGNILAKTSSHPGDTNVTGYQYGQGGSAGPNAVSQAAIGGVAHDLYYDANGAITYYDAASGDDKWITWNARQLPTEITVGDSQSTLKPTARDRFQYGPNGQRFYRETSWWDEAEQTLHTEKAFIVGKFEDLLPANDPDYQRIQKTRIDSSVLHVAATDLTGVTVGTLEYLHRDHLGSIEKVTDEAGNIILDTAFDAFGQRRSADWQGEIQAQELEELLSTQGLTTRRGFTGHEHLDRTGLIHMNGRVYDPQLGRFLSPDPFVQAPANSQSWNRYSYVLNNPLSFTDPSGYMTVRQKFTDYVTGDNLRNSGGWLSQYGNMESLGCNADVCVTGVRPSSPEFVQSVISDYQSQVPDKSVGSPGEDIAGNGGGATGDPDEANEQKNTTPTGTTYNEEVIVTADPSSGRVISSMSIFLGTTGFVSDFGQKYFVDSEGYWRGKNGKTYSPTWGGNQYTGGRTRVLKTANMIKAAGKISLVGSVAISGSNIASSYNSGDSEGIGKGFVDIGMAVVGLAWPVGTIASLSYFSVDVANGGDWNNNGN